MLGMEDIFGRSRKDRTVAIYAMASSCGQNMSEILNVDDV
jgi:hypothetical protein